MGGPSAAGRIAACFGDARDIDRLEPRKVDAGHLYGLAGLDWIAGPKNGRLGANSMGRKKLSHGNQNRRKKPAPARDDSMRHGHLLLARHAGADLSKGYFVQADTVPAALQQENRSDCREGEGFKGEETGDRLLDLCAVDETARQAQRVLART